MDKLLERGAWSVQYDDTNLRYVITDWKDQELIAFYTEHADYAVEILQDLMKAILSHRYGESKHHRTLVV